MNTELQSIYQKAIEKQDQNKKSYLDKCKDELVNQIKEKLTDKNFKQFPVELTFFFDEKQIYLTQTEKSLFATNFSNYLSSNNIDSYVKYLTQDNLYSPRDHLAITIKDLKTNRIDTCGIKI